MHIEDYFDFLTPEDIRIRGHRIGIETVLYDYIFREQTPEQIARRYDTLTLEQVYATILYYLHYREKVDAYLAGWLEHGRRMRDEQERNPPPVVLRVRALKEKRRKAEQYDTATT